MAQEPQPSVPDPTTTAAPDTIAAGPLSSPAEHEQLSPSASIVQERTDSPNLPPHLRKTITRVPVTPDFDTASTASTHVQRGIHNKNSGSYFGSSALGSSTESQGPQPAPASVSASQSPTSIDLLKKTARNNIAMAARRDSLTDIRQNNPDLALSGNIISATFNIPHSLDYRKGTEWVSLSRSSHRTRSTQRASIYQAATCSANKAGLETPPRPVRSL